MLKKYFETTSCISLLVAAGMFIGISSPVFANPEDGVVSSGTATISSTIDKKLDIIQSSQNVVIDWRSFDIAPDEHTQFYQPSSSSVALNRIQSGNASQILGKLTANGNVIIVNPSGVFFGKDSVVDVNGLVASSSDISNTNLMDGNLVFNTPGHSNASITNEGTITAKDAGLVGLVAPQVSNKGVIKAKLGKVQLASGDKFSVDLYGDGLMNITLSEDVSTQLINNSGSIHADGGSIELTASSGAHVVNSLVNISGELQVPSISSKNGKITISSAGTLINTGTLNTGSTIAGTKAGDISIKAKKIAQQGKITSDSTSSGLAGSISLDFEEAYLDSESSLTSAKGASTSGGIISVKGATGSRAFISGSYDVSSTQDIGGAVTITTEAGDLKLFGSRVNADGKTGGGKINIGGEYQGTGATPHASTTSINYAATLTANATEIGDGGQVIVWSDTETKFGGKAYAIGGALSGNGGLIELSSKDTLQVAGNAITDASSPFGLAGSLLLDPKNIIIATGGISGGISSFEFVDPNPDSGSFGGAFTYLSTGNVAVIDSSDDFVTSDTGAVYLFNGSTGGLISTLTGSTANDRIGFVGYNTIIPLTNGNFVIGSSGWDNGGIIDVGAVTWINGTTGLNGVVSAANSLIGSTAFDYVGNGSQPAYALANGNYVVSSWSWRSGGQFVGAATWGNGTTGTVGAVSAANSIIGSRNNDMFGSYITTLSNGNYVIGSPYWYNGAIMWAGAVTWGNGLGGTAGAISSTNSLVGSTASDLIFNVRALSNGNYVVMSNLFNNGGITDAGSVTWANGLTGITGVVSSTNSLVGSTASDQIGTSFAELSNGDFVIGSSLWNDGGIVDAGAVTKISGTAGLTGTISAANSIIGSAADNKVGEKLLALTNGNYVIGSPSWDNGGPANIGAATWVDGSLASTGTVTAANSLIGSQTTDNVGKELFALTNGNYVVGSEKWDDGGIIDVGAATWMSGTASFSGIVSSANSLVGSTASDSIGSFYSIISLTNGNYVVGSSLWNNGGIVDAGAITWGNGLGGTTGAISATNSLVGTSANDGIGNYFTITPLTNGNYVAQNPNWDNGAITNAGAVTWGNGLGGTVGSLNSTNSLVGTTANDQLGYGVLALASGNYVAFSNLWDNGAIVNAGAITIGDGLTGTSGTINSSNSYRGLTANSNLYSFGEDTVNNRVVTSFLSAQRVLSISQTLNSLGNLDSFSDQSTGTVTLAPSFITDVLNTGTSVTLQASNDITVADDIITNNGSGDGGDLTFQAGRSVLINADITTDNGNLYIYGNEELATGVVDAQRDAGNAVISMDIGSQINTGTGDVVIQMGTGAGKTNTGAGDVSLRDINANAILVVNQNTTGDIVLNSGVLSASALSGDSIILASSRNFINNAGAGALSVAGTSRWLSYSSDPSLDTIGGLVSGFRRFSCTYGGSCPAFGTGNGFLYSITPTLTVTPDNIVGINYGDAIPNLTGYSYSLSGYLGTDSSDDTVSGSLDGSTSYTVGSLAGNYNINYSSGTLTSDMGYDFIYTNNTNAFTVTGSPMLPPSSITPPTVLYVSQTLPNNIIYDDLSLMSAYPNNFLPLGLSSKDIIPTDYIATPPQEIKNDYSYSLFNGWIIVDSLLVRKLNLLWEKI